MTERESPARDPVRGFGFGCNSGCNAGIFWDTQRDFSIDDAQEAGAALPCCRTILSAPPKWWTAVKSSREKQKPRHKPWFFVVDDTRLELVTSRTSSGCATSCANRPGGDKRDRTADLLNAIRHKSTVLLASSAFWMQCGCNRFADLLKLSKKWGTRQRFRSGQ